ncbi:MAG TPA: hypothetical protein VHK03_02675 [Aestuariivirgaceae bacterium]|jgi:hypothetical protein|nr:hypothetical protein [Aestuariivirgaceae bacterium]
MRMSKSGLWMTLLAAVGVTAVLARWFKGQSAVQPAPLPKVRSAGPEAMQNPPRRWDEHDQALDESFPASDPPGLTPRRD